MQDPAHAVINIFSHYVEELHEENIVSFFQEMISVEKN